jgi:hypothetical protein
MFQAEGGTQETQVIATAIKGYENFMNAVYVKYSAV